MVNMSSTEMVVAFMAHLEECPMSNDFQEYWAGIWKPLTQRCLNVAKYQFVLQKAFELFKVHKTLVNSSGSSTWSDIFVCKEEEKILKSLCRYVKLQEEELMGFGLNHHRNRCRKYYRESNMSTL